MDFWTAYLELRAKHCQRPEEVAVGAEVSIHTVKAWDMQAKNQHPANARTPSYYNRQRLSRFADERGASKRVVDALRTADPRAEASA